jgi:hypothetical protein
MGRGASLHTTLAALLLPLHAVELPATVPQILLFIVELRAATMQTSADCGCAGL